MEKPRFCPPDRSQNEPRCLQDGLGTALGPLWVTLGQVAVPRHAQRALLGSIFGPPRGPKRAPKRSPKTTKKRSENRCKKRSHVRTVSRPTWGDLGPILVPSWGQEGQKSKKSGCGSNAVHFFKKKWLWLENWAWATTVLEPQPPFFWKNAPFSSHSHFFGDRGAGRAWRTFTGP